MTDLLQQLDEGIGRHQAEAVHPNARPDCIACAELWPCETLKALQGWREAVVEGERLKERLSAFGPPEYYASLQVEMATLRKRIVEVEGDRDAQAHGWDAAEEKAALLQSACDAARAKLKDLECHHGSYHAHCSETNVTCSHAAKLKDAEAQIERLNSKLGLTPDQHQCTGCAVLLECRGSFNSHEWTEHKRANAEEAQNRALVEALERIAKYPDEYAGEHNAPLLQSIAREALAQAKERG